MRIPMIIEGNMGNVERQKKRGNNPLSHLWNSFPHSNIRQKSSYRMKEYLCKYFLGFR